MNSNKCELPDNSKKLRNNKNEVVLRIRSVKHLALQLGKTVETLNVLSRNTANYYREFLRDVKGKERKLVMATGSLRTVQRLILDRILLKIPPSESSYGAIKGKSIKDYALVHANSRYIVKLDIQSFYPSIHSKRVYRFFISQDCSPDVANLLTPLTTRNHSLPLGTSTSPMLADLITRNLDKRIKGMADKVGLKYTRYVDDIMLSGNFPLERISKLVAQILKETGFKIKKSKLIFYKPNDKGKERLVLGVSVKDGKLSAPLDYVKRLESDLKRAIYQSRRQCPAEEFETRQHYRGQVAYVMWLDPKVGKYLIKLYRKVKWKHLEWTLSQSNLKEIGQ